MRHRSVWLLAKQAMRFLLLFIIGSATARLLCNVTIADENGIVILIMAALQATV
jgi:hypothetical protein